MIILTSFLLCLSFTAISSDPLRSIFRTDIRVEKHNVAIGPPVTIPAIDLPNYLGRWYSMYDNLYWRSNQGRNGECVTADYGLNIDGTISVNNNARKGGPDSNKTSGVFGYAFIPDPAKPGQILVDFPGSPPGEYWIIMLGPLEESYPSTPLYQYAVITNSRREPLFILGRDPDNFSRFEDEILEFVEQNGFDRLINRPIPVVQNSDCIYAGVDY